MAQCKDCIHEKVCLHRVNIQTDTYAYMGVKYDTEKCKHYTSADAVPKSEVERLEKDNEKLTVNMNAFGLAAKRLKEEKDALIKNYAECMKDYVREIFEEMQSCLIQRHWNGLDIVSFEFDAVKYAELKKKYTKEGE